MEADAAKKRGHPARRWMIRIVAAWAAIWLFYASPIFIVSMVARVAMGDFVPRSVSRMPGPWGDGYLVDEGGADGYYLLYDAFGRVICIPEGGLDGEGDGGCPGARSERWMSIPLWSWD